MSPPITAAQAARDEFDRQEVFRRLNHIEVHGCGMASSHDDHEKRIRRVEEIAIALGTLPADHERRLRTLERSVVWFAGVAATISALLTAAASTIFRKVFP